MHFHVIRWKVQPILGWHVVFSGTKKYVTPNLTRARRVPYLTPLNRPPVIPNIGNAMGNVEVRFSVGLVIFVSAAAADKFLCSIAASPWLWRHSWRWHWGPLSEAPRGWARPRPLSHQLKIQHAIQFSHGAPVIPLRPSHGEACGITPRRGTEFLTVNSLGVATVSVSPVPVHLPKRQFWTVLHPGLAFSNSPIVSFRELSVDRS